MRFWFDTEFIEDGRTIDLISIGVFSEDRRKFYAEVAECDLSRADQWVKNNVFPHLHGRKTPRAQIASDLIEFMGNEPEIWAYYAGYDWVALCQLYGRMIDLPNGWPMFCRDVKQLADCLGNPRLPKQEMVEHNALADAIWAAQAWDFAQLSPLLESAVLHIASLKLSPYEHAALAAVAVNRLAAGTLLSLARSDCRDADPSPEQKERIQQLLARELGNTEEVIQAAAERFMSGGRVQ